MDVAVLTRGYVDPVPTTSTFDRVTRRFRGLNPWAVDAVIGTLFTVFGLVSLFVAEDVHNYYKDPDALAVLLSLACTLPFYVRRRLPLTSLVVTDIALVFLFALKYTNNAHSQLVLVAIYSVASHGEGWRRVAGFLATEVCVSIVAIIGAPDTGTANILFAGALYASAFFLGTAMRNRRLYMEQLEERAVLLERERYEEAKRAVADERLRIAQELHDVVAHSMGVIAVQAGVGAHVIDKDPVEAKKSLEAISRTSRSTLTELRRLLGVLREDTGAEYAPAPGLETLDALVADVSAAGVPVTCAFEGEHREVPPGVDFTAYRIVQEGLTNVLKHAGPARATVRVSYEPGTVRLEIVDDGRGVNGRSAGSGHGLLGMRERVAVYGGTLDAGPRVGGGFRVVATLPYGEPE
jgi:signal transduction histidine kinase